jgi:hypothetical protein
MNVVTYNPYTGKPRDPRDIESDPSAVMCVKPGEPLRAAHREVCPGSL